MYLDRIVLLLFTATCIWLVPARTEETPAKTLSLTGAVVPMITPFHEDKSLDETALRAFTEWLCKRKAGALFPMGGSGEFTTLTMEERKRIIEIVVESAERRLPVIPGVGAPSLKETLELARYARERGADGVTVVVPTHIDATEESIFSYYAQIDQEIDLPIIIYDPKGKGPYGITVNLMTRFAGLKNIRGIKFRSSDMRETMLLVQAAQGKIQVMAGIEYYLLPTLAVGGTGAVGGGCNIFPDLIHAVCERFHKGDHAGACRAQLKIEEAAAVLNRGQWPLSAKVALAQMGLPIKPVTRGNHAPISEADANAIGEYFRRLDQEYK